MRSVLVEAGVRAEAIADAGVSTASATGRFFSYRASGGSCGRHAAVAVLGEVSPADLGWVPAGGEGSEL